MKGPILSLLIMLAIVGGAFHAFHDYKKQQESLVSNDEGSNDLPSHEEKVDKSETDPDFEPRQYQEALAWFDSGKIDEAQNLLRAIPVGSRQSLLARKIRLALDKVRLFRELTEIVPRHQFVDGQDLYLLGLPKGESVIARIRGGTDLPRLKMALRDGRRIDMKKSRLRTIEQLSKEAFLELTRREYEARLEKLGDDPRPVSLFRTVIAFCLEFGLREEAFKHLQQALKKPAGGILIDLFCESDLAALHRAHADFAGVSEIGMSEIVSSDEIGERERIFRDEAKTANLTESGLQDRPQIATPKKKANPVLSDPFWKELDRFYLAGLRVYRRSLSADSDSEQALIAQARELFQKAQESLYKLDSKFPDNPIIERRGQDLQQLIYDCVKRDKL